MKSIESGALDHDKGLEAIRQGMRGLLIQRVKAHKDFIPEIEAKEIDPELKQIFLDKLGITEEDFLRVIKRVAEERSEIERKNTETRDKKTGRNEPCYCGSGKKLKKCCGK